MAVMTAGQLAEAFDAHAAFLALYARQFVPVHRAEDLVQEVFVKLAMQVNSPANVKAWLLLTLRHAALDAAKSERRREKRDRVAGEERSAHFVEAPAGAGLTAVELQKVLEGLPGMQREIITLRIWAEGTFEEIAAVVKLPLSTVYQQYRAGLETLRQRWELPCRKK